MYTFKFVSNSHLNWQYFHQWVKLHKISCRKPIVFSATGKIPGDVLTKILYTFIYGEDPLGEIPESRRSREKNKTNLLDCMISMENDCYQSNLIGINIFGKGRLEIGQLESRHRNSDNIDEIRVLSKLF